MRGVSGSPSLVQRSPLQTLQLRETNGATRETPRHTLTAPHQSEIQSLLIQRWHGMLLTPALFCQEDTAQGTDRLLLGFFFLLLCLYGIREQDVNLGPRTSSSSVRCGVRHWIVFKPEMWRWQLRSDQWDISQLHYRQTRYQVEQRRLYLTII